MTIVRPKTDLQLNRTLRQLKDSETKVQALLYHRVKCLRHHSDLKDQLTLKNAEIRELNKQV